MARPKNASRKAPAEQSVSPAQPAAIPAKAPKAKAAKVLFKNERYMRFRHNNLSFVTSVPKEKAKPEDNAG